MRVLVIGNGGREHAIGYKLSLSPKVEKLYFAPGNGGTCGIGENVEIGVTETQKLVDFAKEKEIDLAVVGPELPLSVGVSDALRNIGVKVFGPDKNGAQLETSKSFSKAFMRTYNIPTADYEVFENAQDAQDYLEDAHYPIVIKADGLAAGKGVLICENLEQANQGIEEIMVDKMFGDQGSKVVIEEFLTGKEVSLLCFTDGETIVPMETASDYKRAHDNDEGLNTGGMGSISPSSYYENGSCDYIAARTLNGIKQEGFDYRGVVYIGLMLTENGPKVLEYNVRFGDPETQALMMRLDTDIADIAVAVADKKLAELPAIRWSAQSAVTVIIASKGYPQDYEIGEKIVLAPEPESLKVFHSGTKLTDGKLLSNGGRVLAVTALGDNMEKARECCYKYIEKVEFPNSFYRKDIGEI